MRGEDEMAKADVERQPARRLPATPILLGALAGLALCGLGYFTLSLIYPSPPDIQPTTHAICADLTAQRYDQLYTLLDPALQAQGTEAQFVASQRELDQLQGHVTGCATASVTVSGVNAGVTFTLTRADSRLPAPAQATLTTDGASWRVTAYTGAF